MKDISKQQKHCLKCKVPLVWVTSFRADGIYFENNCICLNDMNKYRCPKCFRYYEDKIVWE